MRDLARSLRLSGRPVPVPWTGLAHWIRPRAGDLMLVLGSGGVGKSAFALEWAISTPAPTLYVSLDTSLVDHGIRLSARTIGITVEQVQEGHDEDPVAWSETWGEYIASLPYQTRFCDQTDTVREIDELVRAETEYWGEPPLVTVVDNLSNVLEKEEGAGEYRRALAGLHKVGKQNDTMVMALHHLRRQPPKKRVTENDDNDDEGTKPVHLEDALYEGDKEAQFVLGLWRPQWNRMAVGVLKNRMGEAARNGALHTSLYADLKRMRITSPLAARSA